MIRFMALFLVMALFLIGPITTHASDSKVVDMRTEQHKPLADVNCNTFNQRFNSLGRPSTDSILLAQGTASAELLPVEPEPTQTVVSIDANDKSGVSNRISNGQRPNTAIPYAIAADDTLGNRAIHIEPSINSSYLPNANWIHSGQNEFIPLANRRPAYTPAKRQAVVPLLGPFQRVWIEGRAIQGEAVHIWLQVANGTNVRGQFGDQFFRFRNHCGFLWGLVAFDALHDRPGQHNIQLHATQNGKNSTSTIPIPLNAGNFWTGPAILFPPEKQHLLAPDVVNFENNYLTNIFVNLPEEYPFWRGPFQLPRNASSTAGFGARGVENGRTIGYHQGVDYRGFVGTPFHAPAPGRIVIAEPLRVRGNTVFIYHGAGVVTGYYHMSKMNRSVGDWVETGDLLGEIGNTGLSSGPHLHWEMRVNGQVVNPRPWLRKSIPVHATEFYAGDWAFPYGHFYTQAANGQGGFSVVDDKNARFLSHFLRLGGLQTIGYPISQRYRQDGFLTQAFQKQILQWRPEVGEAWPTNVFDDLSFRGFDDQLFSTRQLPYRLGEDFDRRNAPWEEVMNTRWGLLDANRAIRERYFASPDPITAFGLPTSRVRDMGNHYALRAQRAVFQQWKVNVPWAVAGQVTIANGGDIFKEMNQIPSWAIRPENIRKE